MTDPNTIPAAVDFVRTIDSAEFLDCYARAVAGTASLSDGFRAAVAQAVQERRFQLLEAQRDKLKRGRR